jgi:hypothetical protein
MHLSNAYNIAGKKPPEYLMSPIRSKKTKIAREPAGYIRPDIDGRDSNYFEWINAGLIDVSKRGGTMHQSETILKRMYFGFNNEGTLYMRFDLSQNIAEDGMSLSVIFPEKGIKLTAPVIRDIRPKGYAVYRSSGEGSWTEVKRCEDSAFDKILEIAVRSSDFNATKVKR